MSEMDSHFLNTDLAELDIPDTIKLDFPDPSNILNFNVSIHPDEGNDEREKNGIGYLEFINFFFKKSIGFYTEGLFKFTFAINNNYPHEPPKVHCSQKVKIRS